MVEEIEKTPFWTKKVLTTDEASKYTGLTKRTILNMTTSKIIPHSRPTQRTTFFDREKLERWMLSNPVKSQTETLQDAIEFTEKPKSIKKHKT